jgi:hypothetical protein
MKDFNVVAIAAFEIDSSAIEWLDKLSVWRDAAHTPFVRIRSTLGQSAIFNGGISMTKHFSFPAAGAASAPIAVFGQKSRRAGLFTRIMEALHHSRRIQARRFLRAHRHLVGSGRDICLSSDTVGDHHVDR